VVRRFFYGWFLFRDDKKGLGERNRHLSQASSLYQTQQLSLRFGRPIADIVRFTNSFTYLLKSKPVIKASVPIIVLPLLLCKRARSL